MADVEVRCAARVPDYPKAPTTRPCRYGAGFGPDDAYCHRHAHLIKRGIEQPVHERQESSVYE